jgi:hypothetical protein
MKEKRLSRPQGHSAAGRIMSMENSSDTVGNWTRELTVCIAVPQPTAPPRAPVRLAVQIIKLFIMQFSPLPLVPRPASAKIYSSQDTKLHTEF